MKAAVLVFPGSNREGDVAQAIELVTGRKPQMVWHGDGDFEKTDLIVVPGGFSYGDYLRCGAMAAQSPVMAEVKKRAAQGVPVLAICNGFQIVTEAGLLPGTLMRNAHLKFVCSDVHLKVETSQSLFTNRYQEGQVLKVPVAHAEGNYFADADTLKRLEDRATGVARPQQRRDFIASPPVRSSSSRSPCWPAACGTSRRGGPWPWPCRSRRARAR